MDHGSPVQCCGRSARPAASQQGWPIGPPHHSGCSQSRPQCCHFIGDVVQARRYSKPTAHARTHTVLHDACTISSRHGLPQPALSRLPAHEMLHDTHLTHVLGRSGRARPAVFFLTVGVTALLTLVLATQLQLASARLTVRVPPSVPRVSVEPTRTPKPAPTPKRVTPAPTPKPKSLRQRLLKGFTKVGLEVLSQLEPPGVSSACAEKVSEHLKKVVSAPDPGCFTKSPVGSRLRV